MMEIEINNYRKVLSVQDAFSSFFPFLHLGFYERPGKQRQLSKRIVQNTQKTIGECRSVYNAGIISISRKMNISELKQKFREGYGLSIDVFKKTGNSSLDRVPVQEENALENINGEIEALKSFHYSKGNDDQKITEAEAGI